MIGESGSSKYSSFELLFSAMLGDISDNPFFQSFPKLLINRFSCSLASTSLAISNTFKRARNLCKSCDDKYISMTFFSDIGHAEHSPNNPLKVIHSELDYNDFQENKISFVSTSNFFLDAPKMNRGIVLVLPKPDKNDLRESALSIAEYYNVKLADDNNDLFFALADTYFDYKEKLEQEYTEQKEFHGLRDFYHLIKTAMKLLLKKKEEDIGLDIDENIKKELGIISIERNFSSLELKNNIDKINSLELFKKLFKKRYPNCDVKKEYNVLERICQNIEDNKSRYLLLITKSFIIKYIVLSFFNSPEFKKLNKDFSFYEGSYFLKDTGSKQYWLKILNRFQFQFEKNKILLCKDLQIYPLLINLFKQRFVTVFNKLYTNIIFDNSRTFSLVNDGFRCIILMDEQDLKNQDTYFLNAFEKHIISFDNLMKKEYLDESINISKMIYNFFSQDLDKKLNINRKLNIFARNWDEEEIQYLIYNKILEYQNIGKYPRIQDLFDYILEKFSETLSQDAIFFLKISDLGLKNQNVAEKITNFYQKGEHRNFMKFLKNTKSDKNIIYTFTNKEESLLKYIYDEFETKLLGKIAKKNINEINISSFNSEEEIENLLEKIYSIEENQIKMVIFKFNEEEQIMNYIMYLIENYIRNKKKNENNKKVFIFTVHMKRIIDENPNNSNEESKYIKRNIKKKINKKNIIINNSFKEPIFSMDDFSQIFIDDLKGEDISIFDVINLKEDELNKNIDKNHLYIDNAQNNIINFLIQNYSEILNTDISLVNFLLNNIGKLNIENIFLFLDKENPKNMFELLLDKLENVIIKEEELFNQEKEIKSFQLLQRLKNLIFDIYNSDKKYIKNTLQNKDNILKKIRNCEIKYNSFKIIDSTNENKNLFKEKLNILLFNNKEEVEESMNILYDKFIFISEKLNFLKKLLIKFRNVYEYKDDLIKVENLINLIESEKMNEIDNPEIKNKIDEIDTDFNKIELAKINKYKKSKFFNQIFEFTKLNNNNIPKKESEYFKLAEIKFSELKLLFQSQKWYEEIQEQLLLDCFKVIKSQKRENIRDELIIIIEIFQIKEFDDLKINQLLFDLLSFCQKKEILLVTKNFYNLIIEFEAKQTDLFKELVQIRKVLLTKFDFNKLVRLGKILEYFGLYILDSDEYDRIIIDLFLINFDEGSFKFISNLEDNKIKTLKELVNKQKDKKINDEDIQEAINCSNFFQNLGKIKGIKKDQDLIKEFINEVQRKRDIINSFKNYSKCFGRIQGLFAKQKK